LVPREYESTWSIHVALVALYLRGLPAAGATARSRWPIVVQSLREASAGLGEASSTLRASGLWAEALHLEGATVLAAAESIAERALTPVCASYPVAWRRLGPAAPPALWSRGTPIVGRLVGVVGSRVIAPEVEAFAQRVGAEIARLGASVVSGGAVGCDRAAAGLGGAAGGVRLLPMGTELAPPDPTQWDLSACAPDEPFSRAAAMERNALIYAASESTVVVHARFREGGTWNGAVGAIRRRLCPLIVRHDPDSPAHRALISLGAKTLRRPEELSEVLASPGIQPTLFSLA